MDQCSFLYSAQTCARHTQIVEKLKRNDLIDTPHLFDFNLRLVIIDDVLLRNTQYRFLPPNTLLETKNKIIF
jgi:hypothetical protein